MSRAGVLSDSPRKAAIEKELAFSDKFEDKVKVLCAKCDALFAEYTQQKANEEARMLIEKASLEKAEEANAIVKSSKITSWIFGIISNLIALGALIVAYFAYKK